MNDELLHGLPEPAQAFLAYLAVEKGYSDATLAAYGRDLVQFEACARRNSRDGAT